MKANKPTAMSQLTPLQETYGDTTVSETCHALLKINLQQMASFCNYRWSWSFAPCRQHASLLRKPLQELHGRFFGHLFLITASLQLLWYLPYPQ